jgi:uncharacterized protein (TIGR02147 family)
MSDIFQAADYRSYVKDWIAEQPKQGHGMVSALAQAARCQPAYLSRVLSGGAHLSAEQAFAVAKRLGHSRQEADFLLLLIEWERASDQELKAHYRSKLDTAREARTDLRNRFKEAKTLGREQQVTYYSSAHYAAVHTCISVPEFQTLAALCKHLGLPRERILTVLKFLKEFGLAVEDKGRFIVGQNRLHLSRDSDVIRTHHTNWRIEAIKSLDRGQGAQGTEDFHYSAVVSLSREDAAKLKELWIKSLEEFSKTVAPSNEETVRALVIDFFGLG